MDQARLGVAAPGRVALGTGSCVRSRGRGAPNSPPFAAFPGGVQAGGTDGALVAVGLGLRHAVSALPGPFVLVAEEQARVGAGACRVAGQLPCWRRRWGVGAGPVNRRGSDRLPGETGAALLLVDPVAAAPFLPPFGCFHPR